MQVFSRNQNGGHEKKKDVYFGNSYSEADFDGFEHKHVETNNTLPKYDAIDARGNKIIHQTVKSPLKHVSSPAQFAIYSATGMTSDIDELLPPIEYFKLFIDENDNGRRVQY